MFEEQEKPWTTNAQQNAQPIQNTTLNQQAPAVEANEKVSSTNTNGDNEELQHTEQPKKIASELLIIQQYADGVLDPEVPFLGPLKDGGTIIAYVAPGGWGPMITPLIKGSQEVTMPVEIEGAEVGDSIAIEIRSIDVQSEAAVGGVSELHVDRFIRDPLLKVKCPGCGKLHPQTYLEYGAKELVRCATCQTETAPLYVTNGYTATFHSRKQLGLTVSKEGARKISQQPEKYMHLPTESVQHPSVALNASDLQGVLVRTQPFLGEIGTMPSKRMPASYNAKDAERKLVGAQHEFSITPNDLSEHTTDGHLQVNTVREGAIIICPVKVKGAGLYLGDIRMMQGNGAIARQTASVAGLVQLKVHVLKKVHLVGPVILPNEEDLPYLAKPFSNDERKYGRDLGEGYNVKQIEETFPISVVGTGANLNEAMETAVARTANLLSLSVDEVKNRATIAGDFSIARLPGAVTLTAQFPKSTLKKAGLFKYVKKQYD